MERTKQTIPKVNVTKEEVSLFAEKWGYTTEYDEETNTLHFKRKNRKAKTFYYVEVVHGKVIKRFGKYLPFKLG